MEGGEEGGSRGGREERSRAGGEEERAHLLEGRPPGSGHMLCCDLKLLLVVAQRPEHRVRGSQELVGFPEGRGGDERRGGGGYARHEGSEGAEVRVRNELEVDAHAW